MLFTNIMPCIWNCLQILCLIFKVVCKYMYRIIALFDACAYSWKTTFWEIIENSGAPLLYIYILQLTSVRLYSSRGACSHRCACAKKRANMVSYIRIDKLFADIMHIKLFANIMPFIWVICKYHIMYLIALCFSYPPSILALTVTRWHENVNQMRIKSY